MAKKKSRKKKKVKKIVLLIFCLIVLTALIYLVPKILQVYKISKQASQFVKNSSVSTFMNSKTTLIYDVHGDELCTMRSDKDLYYVSFEEIPSSLQDAFVIMEDRQFYNHSGIDYKAVIRAMIINQKNNEIVQGASTITQQLARNIFLTQKVTWQRKIEEMFIAKGLEKKYSKEQILEFYLNNIYFGNGYYGVEAAARGYFNKSVGELTLSEQAFIAAIPNNPTKYNPFTNFEKTLKRRDLILDELYENDDINSMNYYTAKDETVTLNQKEVEQINNSVVTYVRHCATESMMSASGFSFRHNFDSDSDYENYQNNYDNYYTMCQQMLLSGGYAIYSSIDMGIQVQLQKSIDNNLAAHQEKSDEGVYVLQGSATCVNNETGNVVAIVGSRSQELSGYTLNRAYQSYRQPGSSIKPLIVYTPVLQLGYTPDTIVTDESIDGGPVNADGTYAGDITLRDAVRWSKNTVAWKIYQEKVTPKSGIAFLIQMGFKKVWVDKEYNAVSLGGFTYGVSTEEMAGGYATVENDGTYRKPTSVIKIVDSMGKVVIDETNRSVRVFETNASRMMTDMLKTVVTSGTGVAGQVDDAIIAGKTGTTNSNKDIWYCGYSRYYTTAVWVGYDYPKTISGNYSASIFKQFMTAAHQDLAKQDFPAYEIKNVGVQQATTATEAIEQTTAAPYNNETIGTERVTQETTGIGSGTEEKTTKVPANGSEVDATTATDPDAAVQNKDG
jgi:membrane peptidoglycan carboxypeptidase